MTPAPERKRVLLVSDGYPGQQRPTVHYFVGAEPITIMVDGRKTSYWAFIFQCFETGARRRYGIADRTEKTQAEIDLEIEAEGN